MVASFRSIVCEPDCEIGLLGSSGIYYGSSVRIFAYGSIAAPVGEQKLPVHFRNIILPQPDNFASSIQSAIS